MKSKSRRGAILVLFIVLLPVLILIVGFSIDYAQMQQVRTELRRATDLAAKASANVLCETGNKDLARQAAKDVAALNQVGRVGLTLQDSDIVFGSSVRQTDGSWDFIAGGKTVNAVQITGGRTLGSANGNVTSFFGSLYGHPTFESQCSSTSAFVNCDLCLVLDRSSSMKLPLSSTSALMSGSDPRFCNTPQSDCRWVALEAAVNVFLNELDKTKAKERIGMVTFASDYTGCSATTPKTSIDQSLVEDTNQIRSKMAIKSTTMWNGRTDIAAGIIEGRNVLTGPGARPDVLKVMVVLTDGLYTEADPAIAGKAAADAGITIFAITFSAGANQSDMQKLAAIGKGRFYHAATASELSAAFRDLGGSLEGLVQ